MSSPLRIYLSGRLSIEANGVLLGPDAFPGQQGRAAFALLAGEAGSPVSRNVLADALWPGRPPRAWNAALNSIISKLRATLGGVGLDGAAVLLSGGGCYELRLPAGSWIDHAAALDAIHEAESALKDGDPARAYGPSAVAHHIARRPFLPGEEGAWFEQRREKMASILARALECRAAVYLWNDEHALAVEAAREAVALHPFRETGWQLLMRAHAAAGNTAEALRSYDRCRRLIADELGVPPSRETQAVHGELLAGLPGGVRPGA
ncbi:MAG TPA: BTAD domain-containing putative transcriptional regulator [Longimicrobiales bacterium]|nr:BTAD domain-containing putative transcriptional regulator [Longimicrobiales bacterium]